LIHCFAAVNPLTRILGLYPRKALGWGYPNLPTQSAKELFFKLKKEKMNRIMSFLDMAMELSGSTT